MELEHAIYTRRSIRKYNDRLVERDIIEKIIEAGTWAPSACNVQGWRFIVIDDKKVLNEIVENGAAAFLKNVHQAIMVVYDNRTDNTEYKDYIQSASACIENMLLRAHSLSVGTCWINFLPNKNKLHKILNIPLEFEPIALVSLGYYDQKINERPRKNSQEDIVFWNRFNSKEVIRSSSIRLMMRRIERKVYFALPVSWKRSAKRILDKKEKKFDN